MRTVLHGLCLFNDDQTQKQTSYLFETERREKESTMPERQRECVREREGGCEKR